MPVTRRGGGASSVLRSSSANLRPLTRRVALAPMGGAAPSSVMVFQPPQASHLPDHLGAVAPQDWQTKEGEDFAMNRLYHAVKTGDKVRFPDCRSLKLAAFSTQIGPPTDLPGYAVVLHPLTAILIGPSARPWMNCST